MQQEKYKIYVIGLCDFFCNEYNGYIQYEVMEKDFIKQLLVIFIFFL